MPCLTLAVASVCWGQNGVEKAKAALTRAVDLATTKLNQGEAMRQKRKWESAIEAYTAGLAVKGTHDENLTTTLQSALEAAKVSMAKRDAER